MAIYDVFNGDADGICALTQLRSAEPCDTQLITGVKRDIQLLSQVQATEGDQVNVLDISLDKNRDDLNRILAASAEVFYVDHHFAGAIPDSDQLTTLINTAADTCTSILINTYLNGQFQAWAVVGAFGDNLDKSAGALAKPLSISDTELNLLKNLGVYINYNGYGSELSELHFPPADLYLKTAPYDTPFAFVESEKDTFEKLETGYKSDMAAAQAIEPMEPSKATRVSILPNEAWARRVSGVYSNDLANQSVDRAHAVLTEKHSGSYLVSVRAPLNNKTGADELCRQFETGGGRKAAAGINDLPAEDLSLFIEKFDQFYRGLSI